MPVIKQWGVEVEVDIDVDINVVDFLDDCSEAEIETVIEWLVDSDLIEPQLNINEGNIMDIEWNKDLNKLSTLRLQITPEEEEIIKTIVRKY